VGGCLRGKGRERKEGRTKTHLSFVLRSREKDRFPVSPKRKGVVVDRVRKGVGRDLVFVGRVDWGGGERVSKSLEDLLGCGRVVADEVGVSGYEGPVSERSFEEEDQL